MNVLLPEEQCIHHTCKVYKWHKTLPFLMVSVISAFSFWWPLLQYLTATQHYRSIIYHQTGILFQIMKWATIRASAKTWWGKTFEPCTSSSLLYYCHISNKMYSAWKSTIDMMVNWAEIHPFCGFWVRQYCYCKLWDMVSPLTSKIKYMPTTARNTNLFIINPSWTIGYSNFECQVPRQTSTLDLHQTEHQTSLAAFVCYCDDPVRLH